MALHGNKSQAARTQALAGFKSGDIRALVATDIAARGIDIEDLPHVVNFEIPNVCEDYVHRIGRTGRAGADGQAVSLVCLDEEGFMMDIERFTKQDIGVQHIEGFGPEPTEKAEPIMLAEVEQLKTVAHLKNLRDFQPKRFTLKAHFNFFYHCFLLSVSPVSVFSLPADNPVRQLSEFEFEHNAIAVLCRVHGLPDRQECLAAWNACVAVLREALSVGDYCAQFFDAVMHFYIVGDGGIMRLRLVDGGVAVEFADCPEYARLGDILLDYRYLITGELREMVAGRSTVHENLETLLLREDLIEYWSFIDQRDMHVACPNKLIVRAPWSFTQKP